MVPKSHFSTPFFYPESASSIHARKARFMDTWPVKLHWALCSQGPHTCLILCCHHLGILNFWTRDLAFSLCIRHCKLCSWSCLPLPPRPQRSKFRVWPPSLSLPLMELLLRRCCHHGTPPVTPHLCSPSCFTSSPTVFTLTKSASSEAWCFLRPGLTILGGRFETFF